MLFGIKSTQWMLGQVSNSLVTVGGHYEHNLKDFKQLTATSDLVKRENMDDFENCLNSTTIA